MHRHDGLGFTLVELLVVITIVTVLAGMLLPAITAIKLSAMQTRCMNNMRQLGMSQTSYANDWDGMLASKINTPETTWPVILYNNDYLERRAYASCPSWGPTNEFSQYLGYGQRWEKCNNTIAIMIPPENNIRVIVQSLIKKTSNMALLADTCGTNPADTISIGKQFVTWYHLGNGGGNNSGMIHFRHRNRSSLLFADGHAETGDRSKIVSLLTTESANPTYEIWGADADGNAIRIN